MHETNENSISFSDNAIDKYCVITFVINLDMLIKISFIFDM